MGRKLEPREQEFYDAVDEVLHYIWDPIGVREIPEARDEYHAYLPQVFSLLISGTGEDQIAHFLGRVATERMGLPARPDHDKRIANLLIHWKKAIQ
jgi:hypothetical protein